MAGVTASVPATSANLGSGFDSFGLALGLYNTVSAEISESSSWRVTIIGEGEHDPALARHNAVVTAMERVFAEHGRADLGAHVFCHNDIPISRGLGSSAAAIVGGLLVANELVGRPFGERELFVMATELEGHPDNVAAAFVGGFTMCWANEEPFFARVEPGGIAAVCVVSDAPLATAKARELLPASVPHADAAFNVGRAGLLTAGIALGRCDLLVSGTADRLHEPYRLHAVPDLETVRGALLDCGAHGAALSGSGPTVIGLVCGRDDDDALDRAHAVVEKAGPALSGLEGRRPPVVLAVDRKGATLSQ